MNIPLNKEVAKASVKSLYPNEGGMVVTAKEDVKVGFRLYDWMGDVAEIKALLNGQAAEAEIVDGILYVAAKAGDVVSLEHPIETVTIPEIVRGAEYQVVWRGSDVVDMLPHGEHMRLYQRNLDVPYVEPTPDEVVFTGASDYGPTQQKR